MVKQALNQVCVRGVPTDPVHSIQAQCSVATGPDSGLMSHPVSEFRETSTSSSAPNFLGKVAKTVSPEKINEDKKVKGALN